MSSETEIQQIHQEKEPKTRGVEVKVINGQIVVDSSSLVFSFPDPLFHRIARSTALMSTMTMMIEINSQPSMSLAAVLSLALV